MKIRLFAAAILLFSHVGTVYASYTFNLSYSYGTQSGHQPTSTGSGPQGVDYLTIIRPDTTGFSDTFQLPAGIDSGVITVSHKDNFGSLDSKGKGEHWEINLNGYPLGYLSNSRVYDSDNNEFFTVKDVFTLTPNAIIAINSNNLAAIVSFDDNQSKSIKSNLQLYALSLTAESSPSNPAVNTPLPAAALLFVPGFAGILTLRKRSALV